MTINFKTLLVAALIMAILPGLWNIVVAVGLTAAQGIAPIGTFSSRLWETFNSFGLAESLIANAVFLLVAYWQAVRLVVWSNQDKSLSKKMALGSAALAASLHLGLHMALGFFLWSDVRIAVAILTGAAIGLFVSLHHNPQSLSSDGGSKLI